jgi:hypothetical protein
VALTTDLRARLVGLLAGTYTAGGRSVTGATFTESPVVLPQQNPQWPDSVVDRTWDFHWSPEAIPLTFDTADPQGQENPYQGPHTTRVGGVLRVQYELARPAPHYPRVAEVALGAIEAATRKATDDAARLRWLLTWPPNWNDIAITCMVGPVTTTQADTMRVVSVIPLTWLVSTSAVTAPGWGS